MVTGLCLLEPGPFFNIISRLLLAVLIEDSQHMYTYISTSMYVYTQYYLCICNVARPPRTAKESQSSLGFALGVALVGMEVASLLRGDAPRISWVEARAS